MDAFWSFPFAKLAYVGLLLIAIAVLAREIYFVMFDRTLYVGSFEYFADGKANPEQAKAFPAHILGQHRLLRSALIEENRRRDEERKPATANIAIQRAPLSSFVLAAELGRYTSSLTDAELKIQGFDIGKLLSLLRGWVTTPAEVTGFVEKSGTVARAAVNWPPQSSEADAELSVPLETGQLSGDSSVAFAIAASIVWTQIAQEKKELRKIPRDLFTNWALVWWDYRQLRGREDLGQEWTDDDKKRWRQARTLVERLVPKADVYPEIWRLRADIIDAIPRGLQGDNKLRTAEEIRDDPALVQGDRKRYAEALGVQTAVAAAQQVQATTQRAQAVDVAQVQQAVRQTLSDSGQLFPGRSVWLQPADPARKGPVYSVTATAIVVDGQNKHMLMLPGYALIDPGIEVDVRLSPNDKPITKFSKVDLVTPQDESPQVAGVILAPLPAGFDAGNTVTVGKIKIELKQHATLPQPNEDLQLLSTRGIAATQIKSVESPFAIVEPRVTGSGDGGAPIIDSSGRLVAMAHSNVAAQDKFLGLEWLFQAKGLKLAP